MPSTNGNPKKLYRPRMAEQIIICPHCNVLLVHGSSGPRQSAVAYYYCPNRLECGYSKHVTRPQPVEIPA